MIFSFGFGLSAHLKLTIENLGIRNCIRTCVDKILRDSLDL